mmetsp:Transcript_9962/g.29900  ORF Transcript_9962/g.29900 Transcript_9962/m.29900 type:complete len:327 (+) Transcript_9962:389-1369(+)
MTSQAARQRAVMGAIGATTEAALSSQLAVTLLTGGSRTQAAQSLRDQTQFNRLRPSSFDAVRLATQCAREQPTSQRVPATAVTVFDDVASARRSLAESPGVPFVLRGAMEEWPARAWTPQHLAREHGDTIIPVEVSIGGGDYRDLHMPRSPAAVPRSFQPDAQVALRDLLDHVHNHSGKDRISPRMCLAQKDLFALIPGLEEGVRKPPFDMSRLYMRSAWLGPPGTTSPLHHDPYTNFYCQIWGRKRVQLFAADYQQHLYCFTNMVLRNTSQVDVNSVDASAFPLFNQVPWQDVTLEAGEMLYIPRKWFHFMEARSPSFSVSYWST